jgi:hypothetical protein
MLYGNCKTRQLERLAEHGNQIPQLSSDARTISEVATQNPFSATELACYLSNFRASSLKHLMDCKKYLNDEMSLEFADDELAILNRISAKFVRNI